MSDNHRQLNAKSRAESLARALRMYLPAVQLNQVANDRQSESKPTVHSRDGAVGLTKTIKDIRQKCWRNTFAAIGYCDLHMRVCPLQLGLYSASFVSELNRIGKQVPNDLLQ